LQGKSDLLPVLAVQYADFAIMQRNWFKGSILEKQLTYWKQRLSDLPVLSLPTDRPRPAIQIHRGARQVFNLDPETYNALKDLSLAEDATLFMVFLAAFKVLLYRYTGQKDIAVGVPIANRHWLPSEQMIGSFVNILVMRTNLSAEGEGGLVKNGQPEVEISFRQVLRRVRETALQSYAHQDLPFEILVAELQPKREQSHSPLFRIMFDYTRIPAPAIKLSDLEWKPLTVDRRASQFDLTMSVLDAKFEGNLSIEYNCNLFEDSTIERMIEHYQNLLVSLLTDPDAPISHLNLLSECERKKILIEWNQTHAGYPSEQLIHQLFKEQALCRPEAIAVTYGNAQVTYAELDQRSDRLACLLRSIGVGPDVLVGIYVRRSPDMIVALLGILKAGGAYLPLDPAFPEERLTFMVEDSGVKYLLTQTGLASGNRGTPQAEEIFFKVPWRDVCADLSSISHLSSFSDDLRREPQQRYLIYLDSNWEDLVRNLKPLYESKATPENLAYVIYTSGSTGKPKGVQVIQRGVMNFLASMRKEPGLNPDDVLLAITTLSFDIAALEIFLPLVTGARIVLAKREEALDGHWLLRLLEESGATVMQATPATWRMLLESGWSESLFQKADTSISQKPGIKCLKALCGGEALPRDLAAKILNRVGELWNMYGPTETTIWSTAGRIISELDPITIGRPIANTQVYILQDGVHPAPIGVAGELYIGGDGLARGYLKNPGLTAEKFPVLTSSLETWIQTDGSQGKRLYKTGDLARWLPDGRIEFLGRKDFQIKVRGFRVELGEIETNLSRHPAIRQAVVIAQANRGAISRLVAYLVAKPGFENTPPDASELRQFLLTCLPSYMIPSHFVFLKSLPLTANGKINRQALPTPTQFQQESADSYIAPRNPIESRMVEIWKSLLSGPEFAENEIEGRAFGIQDNFFEMGGHSLLATRMLALIEKEFEVRLPVAAIFQSPTIEQLAVLIRRRKVPLLRNAIIPIQEGGSMPPFFCVHGWGGGIVDYGEMARLLGSDQPVYGIPAIEGEPHTRIEEMAEYYIQAIRSIQPYGPYRLGGYCFGGVVAFEIARQLRAEGDEIALLAILEGYAPIATDFWSIWNLTSLRNIVSNVPHWLRDFTGMDVPQQSARIRRNMRLMSKYFARLIQRSEDVDLRDFLDGDVELIPEKNRHLMEIQIQAERNYHPQPIDLKITLFRIQRLSLFRAQDPSMGWGQLAKRGVEIRMLDGSHSTILMRPQVVSLAKQLKASLDQVNNT
jgi:amino acid adenylation domain-containing protein